MSERGRRLAESLLSWKESGPLPGWFSATDSPRRLPALRDFAVQLSLSGDPRLATLATELTVGVLCLQNAWHGGPLPVGARPEVILATFDRLMDEPDFNPLSLFYSLGRASDDSALVQDLQLIGALVQRWAVTDVHLTLAISRAYQLAAAVSKDKGRLSVLHESGFSADSLARWIVTFPFPHYDEIFQEAGHGLVPDLDRRLIARLEIAMTDEQWVEDLGDKRTLGRVPALEIYSSLLRSLRERAPNR